MVGASQIPFIGCGTVVLDDGERILCVVEGRGPARGQWSVPAGKLEFGEQLRDGAAREVAEETGLRCEIGSLIGVYHSPDAQDSTLYGVNFVYRGTVCGGAITTTADHPEVRYLSRAEIDGLLAQNRFRSSRLMQQILDDLDAGQVLAEPVTIPVDQPTESS